MRETWVIVDLTLREAWRRKILWTALALGTAFIALYSVGYYFIHREMVQSGNVPNAALNEGLVFVSVTGLYVVSFLGVMLAVLTSVGALSGEIASHTVQALAVKPIRRGSIVVGKWLGLSIMLSAYVAMLAGGVILSTWLISRVMPPNPVAGVALMAFQGIIMLTITIAGGTRLSTVANGVFAFMMYGLAFIGGWLEQFGAFAKNEAAVDIGIVTSLLVPSEAMWRLASYLMHPPALRALGLSPFAPASSPSTVMAVYAVAYTVGCLALAVYLFGSRDL